MLLWLIEMEWWQRSFFWQVLVGNGTSEFMQKT
jgi:hypothetical protein